MQLLVVTFMGADRPGIVDRLAALVREHGGNWETSRMANLAGHFAGVLLVAVPPESGEALREALMAVKGLVVTVEEGTYQPVDPEELWRLELTGQDRPGIVQQISAALVGERANIVDLQSETEEAAMAGGVLFRCVAHIHLDEARLDGLAGKLEAIANDLVVEIELA